MRNPDAIDVSCLIILRWGQFNKAKYVSGLKHKFAKSVILFSFVNITIIVIAVGFFEELHSGG